MSHANAKDEIRALGGRDHRYVLDRLVSVAVERNAARSAPAHGVDTNILDHFKNDFNGARDEARLVLLLSPT